MRPERLTTESPIDGATPQTSEPKVRISELLECAVCGCHPIVQLHPDETMAKAAECACGRRTSWSVLGQEVIKEWNNDFAIKAQSNDKLTDHHPE